MWLLLLGNLHSSDNCFWQGSKECAAAWMECSSSTGIVDSCPVEENVRSNLDFHVKQGSEIWLVSSLDIVAREYLILNWRIIYTYMCVSSRITCMIRLKCMYNFSEIPWMLKLVWNLIYNFLHVMSFSVNKIDGIPCLPQNISSPCLHSWIIDAATKWVSLKGCNSNWWNIKLKVQICFFILNPISNFKLLFSS